MDTFKTPVVTSKEADKHIETIKSQHADILTGMQNQSLKVKAYNDTKEQKTREEAIQQSTVDTERMKINSELEKNRIVIEQKNKELEIKKMALLTN